MPCPLWMAPHRLQVFGEKYRDIEISKNIRPNLTRKWFAHAHSLRSAFFGRWLCVVVQHIHRSFVVATRWETIAVGVLDLA